MNICIKYKNGSLEIFYYTKSYMKTFQFMTFHIKTSTVPKPLPIRYDKVDGFIRFRRGQFRHLVLFDYGLFDQICDKIKYFISEKSD